MNRRYASDVRALTPAERLAWLDQEIDRKNKALDAGIDALDKLSKTGYLLKDFREETLRKLLEARNERLF